VIELTNEIGDGAGWFSGSLSGPFHCQVF